MTHKLTAPTPGIDETSVKTDFEAAISRTGRVKTHFHFWSGASGQAYLHTVFAPDACPLLVRAVVIVVARSAARRKVLYLGRAGDDAPITSCAGFRQAIADGGNEVHVHFLAESHDARQKAVDDLENRIGNSQADQIELAA